MIISKKEKDLFVKYMEENGKSPKDTVLKARIFGDGFRVEDKAYKEYLKTLKEHSEEEEEKEFEDDYYIEHDEDAEIYLECIDVEASREYSPNLEIDKNIHTQFRIAHHGERFHLYSVAETGESVFLVTLNAYQMIKILNDEYYTERFYVHYYESLQKP